MNIAPSEMSIADAKRLLVLGENLLEEAFRLPTPSPQLLSEVGIRCLVRSPPKFPSLSNRQSMLLSSDKDGIVINAKDVIDAAQAVLDNPTGDGARI